MLKNYLTSTFRAIRHASIYSLLNISGLALGIACAALIFLWVEDELSYDYGYANHDRLYSIRMDIDYSGKIETFFTVPGPMPDAIRGTVPGISVSLPVTAEDRGSNAGIERRRPTV